MPVDEKQIDAESKIEPVGSMKSGGKAAHNDPTPSQETGASTETGIIDQIRQTVDDSKVWIDSEIEFQKVRLKDGGSRIKSISVFSGIGLSLILSAFISLLLGIFLTVVFYFGPLIALATVPLAFGLIGFISLRIAITKIAGLAKMVNNSGGITGLKSKRDAGTEQHGHDRNSE